LHFRFLALCSKQVVEDVASAGGVVLGNISWKRAPQTEHGRCQITLVMVLPLDVTVSSSPTLSIAFTPLWLG
jgi:hypothetical protein